MATEQEWKREVSGETYVISTAMKLLDHEFINTAFGSEEMYWAKPIPAETLRLMLSQSLTLGVYKVNAAASSSTPSSPRTPSPTTEGTTQPKPVQEQIGMARFITDYVSTAYLTDVYVLPEYRKHGLGQWLIECCNEVIKSMPALRRAFLVASQGKGKAYYAKNMGFWDVVEEGEHIAVMTRRAFKLGGSG